VQNNVASFGGDKTRVMIFGQSAGAINTCALVASPLAHGLFSSALMESGNCAAETLSDRYTEGNVVVNTTNCASASDIVACLQNAPVSSILSNGGVTYSGNLLVSLLFTNSDPKKTDNLPYGPTVDRYVLDDKPEGMIQAGKHNHVPLIVGTNSKELAAYVSPSTINISNCADYSSLVAAVMPSHATQLLAAYPCNTADPASGNNQFIKILTNAFFTCSSRRALRGAAATQTEPVYRYLFTHGQASHGAEVPYVFDSFGVIPYTPAPAEATLSQQIQAYWVNLAASGNPNSAGLPTWSAYNPTADNALQLETPIANTSAIDSAGCDFWDTLQ
jgi:para-nitrobenzyl esterase